MGLEPKLEQEEGKAKLLTPQPYQKEVLSQKKEGLSSREMHLKI